MMFGEYYTAMKMNSLNTYQQKHQNMSFNLKNYKDCMKSSQRIH